MNGLEAQQQLALDEANARVAQLAQELRAEGWDFVAISISRLVAEGEECFTPGAARWRTHGGMGPVLPRQADLLRGMADELDAEFLALGCAESTEGFVQEAPDAPPLVAFAEAAQ